MKVFTCANGTISGAGQQIKLHHNLREPSNFGDTVPSLARDSLLSVSKLADGKYITVFTPDAVNVYDGTTTQIHVSGEAILRGWRCPETKLWRVPLKETCNNIIEDTTLLNEEDTATMMELVK